MVTRPGRWMRAASSAVTICMASLLRLYASCDEYPFSWFKLLKSMREDAEMDDTLTMRDVTQSSSACVSTKGATTLTAQVHSSPSAVVLCAHR